MVERKETITLSELAAMTGGRVVGNGDTRIEGVCSLDHSKGGHIALALDPSRIRWKEDEERPCALIVPGPAPVLEMPCLIHEEPRYAFTVALRHFHQEIGPSPGIHSKAVVDADAEVSPDASIGPFAVIAAGARIGPRAQIGAGSYVGHSSVIREDTRLYPNVTVMHDVTIGARCIVHPGAVIGSDGFGYTPVDGENLKVPQVGRVEIGDDCEIGANVTIDRATLDATVIENDVKIDNLVQVAHNVRIGAHTRIAAQAGLSGRVIIEDNVVIAGQAGFNNGIRVGKGSVVGGQAGVTRSLPPGSEVSGYPARDHRKALQLLAAQNRLPEILDRLERLERRIGV